MPDSTPDADTETHPPRPRGKVGRPRANPRPLERPPQEEILLVAGRLFAKKGFSGTSTREIAEAAGLRQPSLFHYYPKKELILRALLDRIGKFSLHLVETLEGLKVSPSAKLYAVMYGKVHRICTATYPVGAIVVLPEIRGEAFSEFWKDNERANRIVRGFIEAAIAGGELSSDDPELAEFILRGLPTGPVSWMPCGVGRSPAQTARQAATLQLRSLGATPETLAQARAQAASLDLPAPFQTPEAE